MELSESKWKLPGPCRTQGSEKVTMSLCESKLSSVSGSKDPHYADVKTALLLKDTRHKTQHTTHNTQHTTHNTQRIVCRNQISNIKSQISNIKVARKGGAPASKWLASEKAGFVDLIGLAGRVWGCSLHLTKPTDG